MGLADPPAWLAKRSEVQKAERIVAISVSPWSISISEGTKWDKTQERAEFELSSELTPCVQ
ncbi:MAG: hypothetical protein DHS20C11_12260 [Lysobacteraceae bacterium]|nr:MAG: hypothetical protein DHS20C11_12260 [Xanthomonadaceae bacterium]